jgi:hypothetical protein
MAAADAMADTSEAAEGRGGTPLLSGAGGGGAANSCAAAASAAAQALRCAGHAPPTARDTLSTEVELAVTIPASKRREGRREEEEDEGGRGRFLLLWWW